MRDLFKMQITFVIIAIGVIYIFGSELVTRPSDALIPLLILISIICINEYLFQKREKSI